MALTDTELDFSAIKGTQEACKVFREWEEVTFLTATVQELLRMSADMEEEKLMVGSSGPWWDV